MNRAISQNCSGKELESVSPLRMLCGLAGAARKYQATPTWKITTPIKPNIIALTINSTVVHPSRNCVNRRLQTKHSNLLPRRQLIFGILLFKIMPLPHSR